MASAESPGSLESVLNQATDPNNDGDRWDCIQGFYQCVNQEADGPQVAVRLLAHKIQSPQEKEALQALTVLESCMNNCGKKFHSEAAKFRFLNELIKVLSPKYFGAWTHQTVKDRVTEVLYGWTLWLKEEPKIQEAYLMLKKQGIVKKDPKLSNTVTMAPPPQRTSVSIFDQEEKAKLLDRLLKSGRSEDLETANRLIKSAIREEQERADKVAKRENTLKEVESISKQLQEMLEQYTGSGMSQPFSSELKAVYERCDQLRPILFRLASETVDDDMALAHILEANDKLTVAINTYKTQVSRQEAKGARGEENSVSSPREIKSYHLIDLSALDSDQTPIRPDTPLGSSKLEGPVQDLIQSEGSGQCSKDSLTQKKSYLEELIQLNEEVHLSPDEHWEGNDAVSNGNYFWSFSPSQPYLEFESSAVSEQKPTELFPVKESLGLTPLPHNIFVPLDTIKSSHLEPIPVFDRGGVHISLHFAKEPPEGHPSVAVMVLSTVNTSALSVKNFTFQAAVPKSMWLKLQPASGTQLSAYNPLLPPPALSQVILLANPQHRKVRLRYRLALTHGEQQLDESGEIDSFPQWAHLIDH